MKLNKLIKVALFSLISFGSLALMSCEDKGPAEKVGEKVDEGVEEVNDEIDDATDER